MKVKKLIEVLKKHQGDREVVLYNWDGENSSFIALELSCTPRANSKNLLVLVGSHALVERVGV